jgi:exopolysaccharide biosynthesis polyprenyl glycosylphosphotransferase
MGDLRKTDYTIPFATVLLDASAIECSFLLAYFLRAKTMLFERYGFVDSAAPPVTFYIAASLLVIPVWLLLFHSRKMYRPRRNVSLGEEFLNVATVVSRGMLVVLALAFFYRTMTFSRIIFVMAWGFAIVSIFAGRSVLRSYERRMYRLGRHLQKAVIVGTEEIADSIVRKLNGHRSFGFTIAGYFAAGKCVEGRILSSLPYLGTLDAAAAVIRSTDVETVFVALAASEGKSLASLVDDCEGVNVEFLMVPDIVRTMTGAVKAQELEGIPFLTLKSIPITVWGMILKRGFDLVISALILIPLLPLGTLIAALIKLTSPGPVFYTQERVGLDGKRFRMIKFRSMRVEAEASSGPVWTSADDPRRTAFGVFLRKSSIDELPQLINVLVGDMSLVGPRPERPFFVDRFKDLVPKYLDRHRVKTGMTGWAQVNGLRGDTSLEERIKYDLYYIENWSMAFDIRILFRTIHTALNFKEVH